METIADEKRLKTIILGSQGTSYLRRTTIPFH